MRGLGRRLRSTFGIGSSRMAIRSQMAWQWRFLVNLLLMAIVAGVVWWLVQNSYRITGFNHEEARQRLAALTEENARIRQELEASRASLIERERMLQVDKAAQTELARSVAQLQDENASLKEDLGFLRRLMSSGTTPEGIGVSDLKVERDGSTNQYRYRMLLTQGGQRKQDFKGRVQLVARVAQGSSVSSIVVPPPEAGDTGAFEFRFYHKVEGRFSVPEGAQVRSVDVRVLAVPGGQVKLSRTLNMS
ncbi:MAG TPA: DUF6776 family protein [Usitatibacter sp.]|nr:DUF6776 family protein [Usitatibacter sp.]